MNLITKHSLYLDIHQAIEHSVNNVRNMQEPDYIAALITKFPLQLSHILNHYFPLSKFRIGGCFIHQKPLARFIDPSLSKSKAPEIGDLLVVYKEIGSNGIILHNALLLQAKKATNIFMSRVKSADKHQLKLYREWPEFEYKKAGALDGQTRNISPKTITSGAQYLLINDKKKNTLPHIYSTFWCAIPNDILVASKSLALEIIDFIEFQTGRPFVPKKTT